MCQVPRSVPASPPARSLVLRHAYVGGMSMGRVTMSQPRVVQILEEFFDSSGRPVKLMA